MGVSAAVVNEPEQRQQLRPGAKPGVHRVGVQRSVFSQALEQARHGVVPLVHLAAGHQPAVFRVQTEHQPHQRAEQAAVYLLRVLAKGFRQQRALGFVVGPLKSSQQLPQRFEHLLCQLCGDDVLELSALAQQGRQTLGIWPDVRHPVLAQQGVHGAGHRASERFEQVLEPEREVAGGLARRRIDQPQVRVVEQQPNRHAVGAQHSFKSRVRRGAPAFRPLRVRLVEVGSCIDNRHQSQIAVAPWERHRIVGRKAVVVLGQRHRERLRQVRTSRRARQQVGAPLEHLRGELGERVDAGLVAVGDQLIEHGLHFQALLAVDAHAVLHQYVRRYHQAHLLDLAEPFLVHREFWRVLHPVTGQRYTSPAGSKRAARTS